MVKIDGVVGISWKRYSSYENAEKIGPCVYIFEWDGFPRYVGKIEKKKRGKDRGKPSTFGARYIKSYRHLINGALDYGGARLFIGTVDPESAMEYVAKIRYTWIREEQDAIYQTIGHTEEKLIALLPHKYNFDRKGDPDKGLDRPKLILQHSGDVPEYLK